jgi:nicotinamide-nucleotide amidase
LKLLILTQKRQRKFSQKMKAEILATGDEIRSGALVDSNSAFISDQLEQNGVEVIRHTSVGDDIQVLAGTLREIGKRVNLAVVTGGLGPTTDDLSAEAAATAAGVELEFNAEAFANVESFFKESNRPMSESNKRQALLPKGCSILYNPVGTAPGFSLFIEGCLFFFLPGVPYEMKRMLTESVIPTVIDFQGDETIYSRVKTFTTFGLPESLVGEKMADVEEAFPPVKLGLRANFPQIQVKLYCREKGFSPCRSNLGSGRQLGGRKAWGFSRFSKR